MRRRAGLLTGLLAVLLLAAAPAAAAPLIAAVPIVLSIAGATQSILGLVSLVASIGLSFASAALAKQPQGPDLANQSRTQMIRQPVVTRRRAYGRVKLSGGMVFIHSRDNVGDPSSDKDWLHVVLPHVNHPIDGVESYWLDADEVAIDQATGAPTEYPWLNTGFHFVDIWTGKGSLAQPADPVLVADTEGLWSEDHRGRGIAYTHVRFHHGDPDVSAEVFPGSDIKQLKAVLRTALVYDPRAATLDAVAVSEAVPGVITLADDHVELDDFNDAASPLAAGDWVFLRGFEGFEPELSGAYEVGTVPNSDSLTLLDWHGEPLEIVEGGTPGWVSRLRYSPNWALCVADHLHRPAGEGGYGSHPEEEIDWDLVATAADISDETVTIQYPLPDGPAEERRYECNGAWETSDTPIDTLRKLLTAGAGDLDQTGGKWRLFAGAWQAPTDTLTAADLRAPITDTKSASWQDSANGVRGLFISPDRDWQPTDFPPTLNPDYLAEDGGEEQFVEPELDFTISAPAAQRIGKIRLERARRERVVAFPGKITCFGLTRYEVVTLDLPEAGITGTWRVEKWELVEVREQDGFSLGIDLILREWDEAIFAWDPATDEQPFAAAERPELPDSVTTMDAPEDLAAIVLASDEFAGNPHLRLTWSPPAKSVKWYEIQWRLTGETAWTGSAAAPSGTTELRVPVPDPDIAYDVRLRAYGTSDVPSPWITASPVTQSGDTTPPSLPEWDASTPTAVAGNNVTLRWTNPPESDYRRVRIWRATADDSGVAVQIANSYGAAGAAAEYIDVSLADGTYYWFLSAQDHTSNSTGYTASRSATVAIGP